MQKAVNVWLEISQRILIVYLEYTEKYYVATKNQNQKVVKDVISSFDQSKSKKKSKNAEDFSITSKSRNVHLRMRREVQTNMKDDFSQTEDFIFSSLLAEKQINGIFKHAPALPSSLSCQVYFFSHLSHFFIFCHRVSWICPIHLHSMNLQFWTLIILE